MFLISVDDSRECVVGGILNMVDEVVFVHYEKKILVHTVDELLFLAHIVPFESGRVEVTCYDEGDLSTTFRFTFRDIFWEVFPENFVLGFDCWSIYVN